MGTEEEEQKQKNVSVEQKMQTIPTNAGRVRYIGIACISPLALRANCLMVVGYCWCVWQCDCVWAHVWWLIHICETCAFCARSVQMQPQSQTIHRRYKKTLAHIPYSRWRTCISHSSTHLSRETSKMRRVEKKLERTKYRGCIVCSS